MTKEEAKQIFLNRGFVNGIFDGDKWREAIIVISNGLEDIEKTAEWIDLGFKDEWWCEVGKCSNCGEETILGFKYCPNCGAKMSEVE